MINKKSQIESERYHNVYAAIHGDDVMVTTRNINLSLSYLQDSFEIMIANRRLQEIYRGKTPDKDVAMTIRKDLKSQADVVQDENGRWYVAEKDGIEGSSHLIYDSDENDFYYADCSFPPHDPPEESNRKNMLMRRELINWAKKNFDVDDESKISFHSGAPIPYRHYEIHKLSEYPGIFDFMKRNEIDIEVDPDEKVIFVNCDDPSMLELANEIGYVGRDFRCTMSAFRYVVEGGRELFRVNPPFYFVNSAGKGRVATTRSAVKLIMEQHVNNAMFESENDIDALLPVYRQYTKGLMNIDLDCGVSFGKLMYDNALSAYKGELDDAASEEDAARWISQYSIGDNKRMIDFVRYFKFMTEDLFPFENYLGSAYNRTYYYIAKRSQGSEIRYQALFDDLFEIGDSFEMTGFAFDILYSWYSIPEVIFKEFGYETVCDQKIYDNSINIVTRSIEYSHEKIVAGQDRDPDYENYVEEINRRVLTVIEGTNSDDYVRDHMEEVGDVRNILDYPMVYSEISEMFRNRGVKYDDIPVIMIRDESNPGMRGGYCRAEEKDRGEQAQVMGFDPPYIIVNLINPSNKTNDDIADVLVHEGSHFIDDLMVQQGLEGHDVMYNPPRAKNEEDVIRFWREYLSSPTEFTAHMVQAFMGLKNFSREKVKRDGNLIVQDIIKKVFIPSNRSQIFLTENVMPGSTDVEVNANDINNVPDLSGKMVDVVHTGAIDEYTRTGLKTFDSAVVDDFDIIRDSDPPQVIVYFKSPLTYSASVSEGAHLSYPSVNDFRNQGEITQLYAGIIRKAIEYYVDGGTFPPRGL